MEVKVYVDGIQRVVCGATWDTTCQDVVIALAHALGRTGRFTLIEKWRDNERPLTPAECPLQVLHKWGEYAAEVRFILCQADSDRRVSAAAGSQERLVRRGMEKSVSLHRIMSPQIQGAEPSVKRSLTFSGAHNQPVEGPAWMSAAMPTSKLRKTQQGPVPDGDLRLRSGVPLHHHHPHPHPHSHHHPLHSSTQVRQVKGIGGSGNTQSTALSSSSSSSDHPHHRCPSPSHGGEQQGGSIDLASSALSSVLSHRQLGDASRPSAFQPPKNLRSRAASPPKCSTAPEGFGRPQPQPQSRLELQPSTLPLPSPDSLSQPSSAFSGAHPQAGPNHPHPNSLGLAREPQVKTTHLPSSPTKPLPDHPPHSQPQSSSLPAPHKTLDATSTVPDPVSSQGGLQIEEYDLDHNFPGSSHKDWNHNEAPLDSLEYRLEEGLGSGMGSGSGGHLEGEHAKLLRLVNMQQQRLKTQESQISLVNTEISNLEEKEMEYEENLHVIMEELLLQENRQRELEPQLHELDKVNWETAAEEEKKTEIDLTLQVASCKATILDQEAQLDEVRSQESRLLQELQQEEDSLAQEKARLEQEESEARAEESRAQEEIDQLQTQASQLQETSVENQASQAQVESELASLEEALKEKEEVVGGLEADLKEENLKGLAGQAVSEVGVKASDSQNVLRRILEDSLSPRGLNAGGFHSEGAADNPLPGPALLAAFATSNQSGVWV